jgi:hypothetical protein
MPRIRTLKPEVFQHRKVGRLSIHARWLWLALLTHADDEGRLVADPGQLRITAFPYDRDITDEQVDHLIGEISATGLVRFYEVDGVPYACFPSWCDHQKIDHPSRSKLPEPQGYEDSPSPRESSASTRRALGESARALVMDQGSRIKDQGREQGTTTTAPGAHAPGRPKAADAPGFAEWFWPLYPKHVARARAVRAWNRLKLSDEVQAEMRVALERDVKSAGWTKENGLYVPHPASWLNGRRWEDEATKAEPAAPIRTLDQGLRESKAAQDRYDAEETERRRQMLKLPADATREQIDRAYRDWLDGNGPRRR